LFDEHYENLLKEVVRVYEEKHKGERIPKIKNIKSKERSDYVDGLDVSWGNYGTSGTRTGSRGESQDVGITSEVVPGLGNNNLL
jgi:hypothetical protein